MQEASATLTVNPVGQYVTVALLAEPPKSTVLHVVNDNADMTQRATILSVGQGVPDLRPGQTVLCRPMQGHYIGDLILLPHSAVIATLDA